MKTMLLIAGVAAVGLTASASQAATHHRHHGGVASAGTYAQPKTPIAYTQLSAYLKASPRQRAGNDWSGQMAATTGANVNAAATTAAPPPAATDASTQAGAQAAPTPEAAPAPAAAPAQPPAAGGATQPAQPQ